MYLENLVSQCAPQVGCYQWQRIGLTSTTFLLISYGLSTLQRKENMTRRQMKETVLQFEILKWCQNWSAKNNDEVRNVETH